MKYLEYGGEVMSMQEQAVQMINDLSDENVKYLIDFMQRFMMPKSDRERDSYCPNTRRRGFYAGDGGYAAKSKSLFPV